MEGGDASPGAGTRFALEQDEYKETVAELIAKAERDHVEPVHAVASADELLQCGIGDYTYLAGPKGILGRGKFSTVYKVIGPSGDEYALKHTPLYPHHPLIAARLLREPTLLAEIPPHPCLVRVQGWVKSKSHFYLIETLSRDHVPLSDIRTPISRRAAKKILDQLVSVVRDGLHQGGRVCHRDLKGENVLIDQQGNLILLDLGLATHFSLSEPKLTTCCGSPAFHSPEIVDALNQPPGNVCYYGPELDIWCIALTVLSLLINRRYPIGTNHEDLEKMQQSVKRCFQELDDLFPMTFGDSASRYYRQDIEEWRSVRVSLQAFLEMDGLKRMEAFEKYELGEGIKEMVAKHKNSLSGRAFKSVSFEPNQIKYTLPLSLKPIHCSDNKPNCLLLSNPEEICPKKVVSYLKYLLRSAGILYHCLSNNEGSSIILQCVLALSPNSPLIPPKRPIAVSNPSFLSSIFTHKRNTSPPPSPRRAHSTSRAGVSASGKTKEYCLRFFVTISLHGHGHGHASPAPAVVAELPQGQIPPSKTVVDPAVTAKRLRRQSLNRTVSNGDEPNGNSGRAPAKEDSKHRTVTKEQLPVRSQAGRKASRSRTRSTHDVPGPGRGNRSVWIRVSDARALEAVRAALDQKHEPIGGERSRAGQTGHVGDLGGEDGPIASTSAAAAQNYIDSPAQTVAELVQDVQEVALVEGDRGDAQIAGELAAGSVEVEGRAGIVRGRLDRIQITPPSRRTDSPRSEQSSPDLKTPKMDGGEEVSIVEVQDQERARKKERGGNRWLQGIWNDDMDEVATFRNSSPGRVKDAMMLS